MRQAVGSFSQHARYQPFATRQQNTVWITTAFLSPNMTPGLWVWIFIETTCREEEALLHIIPVRNSSAIPSRCNKCFTKRFWPNKKIIIMHHMQFFPRREIHFGASCGQFPSLWLSQWHWAFHLECPVISAANLKQLMTFGFEGQKVWKKWFAVNHVAYEVFWEMLCQVLILLFFVLFRFYLLMSGGKLFFNHLPK